MKKWKEKKILLGLIKITIFLFMVTFGFNAAGLLKNVVSPNSFVSPLFSISSQEYPADGLLLRMHYKSLEKIPGSSSAYVQEHR